MMRLRLLLVIASLAVFVPPVCGQARDSATAAPDTSARAQRRESRFYYGGSLGLSLYGDVLWLTVQPLVGYKLTPKTSVGTRLTCEYVSNQRSRPRITSFDYGGSVFARYRVHPQAYLHAEFECMSLDLAPHREFVPFLLLGGGYVQPLAPKTAFTVEVLFDVLRDERGRFYRDRNARVNVGIGVGF